MPASSDRNLKRTPRLKYFCFLMLYSISNRRRLEDDFPVVTKKITHFRGLKVGTAKCTQVSLVRPPAVFLNLKRALFSYNSKCKCNDI